MATVCSNTSSSSSSSISNSSVQKLAEVNESEREHEENLTSAAATTNQEQYLFYETQLKEATHPTNTAAHSSNLNEFLYFHDDHSAHTAPTPQPVVGLGEGNSNKNIFQNQATTTTNDYQALRIKVKSIENHLLPLVNQITTLVNFRDLAYRKQHGSSSSSAASPRLSSSLNSERNATALVRVGEAVGIAVERFVNVGEKIAYENPSIKLEMLDACRHAKNAGIHNRDF